MPTHLAIRVAMLAAGLGQAATAVGGEHRTAGFERVFWAPLTGNAFRVNSPDTAGGPFKNRPEAKQSGVLKLAVDEDPSAAAGAWLYLELWGGHPGVAGKRVRINGRGEYALPEVGSARDNCTYSYPSVALKLDELRRGENVLAFTCDKGNTFWGHYLLRAACVRLAVGGDHPAVAKAGLAGFEAKVVARPAGGGEAVAISLAVSERLAERIASVEYQGRYRGYDENGDGEDADWHGFTKDRLPVGIVGASSRPPFEVTWDLSMAPDPDGGSAKGPAGRAVRAVVRFKDDVGLVYRTAPAELPAPARRAARVRLHYAADLPRPFWSRAGKAGKCTIVLDADPADIERAELHVVLWDGGRGKTAEPFTLNGRSLPAAGGGRHDVLYRVLPIEPTLLRKGPNEIRVLCDTEHHGIEVLLPGPALIVRTRPSPR